MGRELVRNKILSVINKHRQKSFTGKITDDVLLTKILGEEQWDILGMIAIGEELGNEFGNKYIPDSELCCCDTFGELVDVVAANL